MKIILIFVFCLLTVNCQDHIRARRGIAEVTEKGNEVVSRLTEINSYFKETKFTQYAGKILESAGIVGGVIGTVLSFVTEEEEDTRLDEIIEKVDKLTEQMHAGFESLKSDINKAKNEIIAFMEKANFRSNILLPVEDLTDHIYQYLKRPNHANKESLKTLCQQKTPKSLLNNMKTIIFDGGVTEQLVAQDYIDASFDHLQNLYRSMIMQILVSHPICEGLLYGSASGSELEARNKPIRETVKNIEERFVGENNGRKQYFWSNDIIQRLIKKHIDSSSDKKDAGATLFGDLARRYSETGYKFAVGVFAGTEEIHFGGNTIFVNNYNGMSAFVMTTEGAPGYNRCLPEHKTNYLPQLIEYFFEICPKIPAAAVWKPDDDVHVWTYKNEAKSVFHYRIWGNVGILIANQAVG